MNKNPLTRRPLLGLLLGTILALIALLSLNLPMAGAADGQVLSVPLTRTSTSLTSGGPGYLGSTVTLTALVKVSGSAGVVTAGTVQYYDLTASASVPLGSSPLDNTGHATFNTSILALGNHIVQARYTGAANFQASQSGYVIQSVKTCSATAVLPVNGTLGLVASITASSTLFQYHNTATGVRFTVAGAVVTECSNYGGDTGYADITGTIATVSGPSAIQVGDPVRLFLYNYGSTCFGGSLEVGNWVDNFPGPFNTVAGVSITPR